MIFFFLSPNWMCRCGCATENRRSRDEETESFFGDLNASMERTWMKIVAKKTLVPTSLRNQWLRPLLMLLKLLLRRLDDRSCWCAIAQKLWRRRRRRRWRRKWRRRPEGKRTRELIGSVRNLDVWYSWFLRYCYCTIEIYTLIKGFFQQKWSNEK